MCDDHPLMRAALARTVREHPRLQVLAEADSTCAAIAAIGRYRPDIAITDMRLGDGDAIEVLQALSAHRLPTRVLVISGFEDPALIHRALKTGARGYIPKRASGEEICAAALAVSRGETFVAPELQSAVLAQIAASDRGDDRVALSARERAALQLAARGRNEREIAAELVVSTSSVKSYMRRAYEKLGSRDKTSAVGEAIRRGLID